MNCPYRYPITGALISVRSHLTKIVRFSTYHGVRIFSQRLM